MKIGVSRAVVSAALSGALETARFTPHPTFKVLIPDDCPGVPRELLQPRETWADRGAYDAKARELAGLFKKNFEQYAPECSPEVRAAGPE
jgi:phosphoenolpyruvate carboxykinase (ATP)